MNATARRTASRPRGSRGKGVVAVVAAAGLIVLAGCGSGSSETPAASSSSTVPGTSTTSGPPAPPPITGELRTFTYDDTIDPKIMDPFRAEYPDLNVRTATFDSNDEAAAKIRGGFSTDVIEVCLDEAEPLLAAGLLAPIDTSRVTPWNDLDPTFREAQGVSVDGDVIVVPMSAGPHGMIYDKDAFPDGVDSYQALFDPKNAGRVALDGSWLTALSVTALAMGITDPMHMSDDQVEQVKNKLLDSRDQFRSIARSDSDMANLFKSGEVVVADGGRGTAEQINNNDGNVAWVAPKEGALSWVCGLGISADAENVDAAYALINYYASAPAQAIVGNLGYVIMNGTAVKDVKPQHQATADPSVLAGAIAETEPPNADLWRRAWQEVKVG